MRYGFERRGMARWHDVRQPELVCYRKSEGPRLEHLSSILDYVDISRKER
jgi:hypothetical protein